MSATSYPNSVSEMTYEDEPKEPKIDSGFYSSLNEKMRGSWGRRNTYRLKRLLTWWQNYG